MERKHADIRAMDAVYLAEKDENSAMQIHIEQARADREGMFCRLSEYSGRLSGKES